MLQDSPGVDRAWPYQGDAWLVEAVACCGLGLGHCDMPFAVWGERSAWQHCVTTNTFQHFFTLLRTFHTFSHFFFSTLPTLFCSPAWTILAFHIPFSAPREAH
jgi:hypothetical protein